MTFGSVELTAVGKRVTIDNVKLQDHENHHKDGVIIERKGDYTYLKFSDGVRLKWSSDSLNIFVTVDEQYMSKVSGLCGDYNNNLNNDLLLPDDSYTNEPSIFGNSWRLDSSVSENNFNTHILF